MGLGQCLAEGEDEYILPAGGSVNQTFGEQKGEQTVVATKCYTPVFPARCLPEHGRFALPVP